MSRLYTFTQFLQNLPIERFWVEVNNRVNYPIKTALVQFDNNNVFNMEDIVDSFCVSWVSCKIARFGIQTCISSWNQHPIPGNLLCLSKKLTKCYSISLLTC